MGVLPPTSPNWCSATILQVSTHLTLTRTPGARTGQGLVLPRSERPSPPWGAGGAVQCPRQESSLPPSHPRTWPLPPSNPCSPPTPKKPENLGSPYFPAPLPSTPQQFSERNKAGYKMGPSASEVDSGWVGTWVWRVTGSLLDQTLARLL